MILSTFSVSSIFFYLHNPVNYLLSLPNYRLKTEHREIELFEVTQLVSGKARIPTQEDWFYNLAWTAVVTESEHRSR